MTPKPKLKKLTKGMVPTMKKQYYASEISWLQDFIKARGIERNNYTKKLTEGWQSDKVAFLARVSSLAEDKMAEDLSDKFIVPIKELVQMKYTTLQLLKTKLNELTFRAQERVEYIKRKRDKNPKKAKRSGFKPDEVRTVEVIEIMNAIKRELWEPLTIAKIHNTVEVDEELSEEERDLIEILDEADALVIDE